MKNANRHLYFPVKLILLLLLVPFYNYSQDTVQFAKKNSFTLRGYVKDMQTVFFTDNSASLTTLNFIHNRMNTRWEITDKLHLRAEARSRLFYGEQVKSFYQFGKYVDVDNGIADLSFNLVDDTSIVMNTSVDRLLVNWSNERWDFTAGRQRVNWGVNLVWNPNDIFNAYNYFDFDYEERPGTDAIRIQYTTKKSSVIELAHKIAKRKEEYTTAIIYRTNYKLYDLQGFAGLHFQDLVLGTGWAGNIRNLGFKGEATYFHPYKNSGDTTGALSASISLDRSFKNDYFGMVSYLYTSNAKGNLATINQVTGVQLSARRLMPFEHTFFIQGSKQLNPLLNSSVAMMYSPENNTLILVPSLAVSVADNWDVTLLAQSFFYQQSSSYKTSGNSIFLRLRWSF